jgi:MFS family permease
MRNVIVAQCFGAIGITSFKFGLLLLFLTASGFGPVSVMLLLACPFAFRAILTVPGAYWADSYGKKRLGGFGMVLTVAGFTLIAVAPLVGSAWATLATIVGVAAYSMGDAFMAAGWFALLSPIVPEDERGRFFGRLRFSWQAVAILFFFGASLFLSKDTPPSLFVPVMAAIAASLLVRLVIYRLGIPEIEGPRRAPVGFSGTFMSVLRAEGYMSFCAYVFLLALVTTGCPHLFGLIEKKVLLMHDQEVVWLGNLGMIGAFAGFYLGGRAVDRWGTKPVFLVCHFGYGVTLFGFLFRGIVSAAAPMFACLGVINFAFGAIAAASSVAVSTEMLALIPPQNKSLSTSVCMTLLTGGGALSGILAAGALNSGMFNAHWELWGMPLSDYDAVLFVCALAVVLLVVTLGLVPSVIGKAQWVPRGQ